MLKVLCFGRLHGGSHGGMERHVESLILGLQGEVRFVNLVPSRDGAAREHRLGESVVYEAAAFSLGSNMPLSPGMPWRARRLHREFEFDLAHLHFPDPMSHAAALALPPSLPIVISWHSDIVRQKRLRILYRPFEQRILRRAAAVVIGTPAHFTSSGVLPGAGVDHKIARVPYGVDFARFGAPGPRAAELRRQFGERIVFALGRHVYYKGFEFLIDAMAGLPDAHLLLGGEGPLTAELRQRAALRGVSARVHFLGRVPDEELADHYFACGVFCMPSVESSEAFGLVQVEAMACARPVVCCELHNGVTYVNRHEHTGLVVPPRDPVALGEALRRLLADAALRQRLGQAAAARVREEFSLEAQCRAMLEVYRRAAAPSARPGVPR
jgi:glycosyltransferase involved in cell wall biosynthesis